MKKFFVFLLVVVLTVATLQTTWAEEPAEETTEESFDVAAWDEDITQQFANVAYTEDFPYVFYKVQAEEHYSDVTKTSYTSRSSKFTIEGAWSSSFTIYYDLYDRGFSVFFSKEEKGSTIKDFLTASLMVVFGISREKADEFVASTALSYDGMNRSDFIYSDEMVVFLMKSVIGGTEVVASEREYFKDRELGRYHEMTYKELTAFLNQGEYGFFSGTVVTIARGEEEDTITIQLEDGNRIRAFLGFSSYQKPFIMKVGEKYTFYVYIYEQTAYRDAGDIMINCVYQAEGNE